MTSRNKTPSWIDIKAKLADFDRSGLIDLVQDLYAANQDNQAFLHTRFEVGDDFLKPYKAAIKRWLWPDGFKNQDTSVARAKKAIADYKKAVGRHDVLAELMVFYCEQAAGFSNAVALQDEGYLDALVRMFSQTLKTIALLPDTEQSVFLGRLVAVRDMSRNFGYGIVYDLDELLSEHKIED